VRYTRIKKFVTADYLAAQQEYDRNGSCLDQTLYQLCKDHPSHSNPSWVYAKTFIIGRTYASGIERKVPTGTGQGSSMSKVAELIYDKRVEVDSMLARLPLADETLSPACLKVIAEVHRDFVVLLEGITLDQESPRAFASKYMHCHCQLVPILDGIADAALGSLVRWKKDLWAPAGLPGPPDRKEYKAFLARFFSLYKDWESKISGLSVGRLDAYLIWVENQNQATKDEESRRAQDKRATMLEANNNPRPLTAP
jgi:hypothetical protein